MDCVGRVKWIAECVGVGFLAVQGVIVEIEANQK